MMLIYTEEAVEKYVALAENKAYKAQFKAVRKSLVLLKKNPKHPGLATHKFSSFEGPHGEDVFEAYAQNKTPGAYRIFFYYPKNQKETIAILTILKHPWYSQHFFYFHFSPQSLDPISYFSLALDLSSADN